MKAATPTGQGRSPSRSRRKMAETSRPRTYSMARKYVPPTLPKSNTCTMFGWCRIALMRASWMNISTK